MKSYRVVPQISSRERIREIAKALFAKKGFEATSTAEICQLAGTSQSQLNKHFSSKHGLLEAIFEDAWEKINPAISLAIEKIASPKDKLRILTDMVLTFLEKDKELRTLFLLEGRRIRGDGYFVVLVPGFLEFVRTLDGVVKEISTSGELPAHLNPQAFRSTLIGAIEGMLRDQLISRSSKFPASFNESDIRAIFDHLLSVFIAK